MIQTIKFERSGLAALRAFKKENNTGEVYIMAEKKARERRYRNWVFIVYPDSAPEDWRKILDETHIEWVESPLHEPDEDEELKLHYHCLILYGGVKTQDQVLEITQSINASMPKMCNSIKGYVRYMAHLDNPEKQQFTWGDIVPHNGVDLYALCAPSRFERLQIQQEMIEFIEASDIYEFWELVTYCRATGNEEWFNVAMNYSTMALNAVLRSRRYAPKVKVDPETGEVKA